MPVVVHSLATGGRAMAATGAAAHFGGAAATAPSFFRLGEFPDDIQGCKSNDGKCYNRIPGNHDIFLQILMVMGNETSA